MDTKQTKSESTNEEISLNVNHEKIRASQNKLKNYGILIIVWGYAMSISCLCNYLNEVLFLPNRVHGILKFANPLLPIIALGFTIFYIIRQKNKVTTDIGLSLRYIWIAFFISLMLTNLIIFNVLHEVNFTLQHPIFMVITAFSIVVSGIILRYRLIILGGIVFGALAYICSYFVLRDQMLLDAIAWFIALVIPGHLMYFKRER